MIKNFPIARRKTVRPNALDGLIDDLNQITPHVGVLTWEARWSGREGRYVLRKAKDTSPLPMRREGYRKSDVAALVRYGFLVPEEIDENGQALVLRMVLAP